MTTSQPGKSTIKLTRPNKKSSPYKQAASILPQLTFSQVSQVHIHSDIVHKMVGGETVAGWNRRGRGEFREYLKRRVPVAAGVVKA